MAGRGVVEVESVPRDGEQQTQLVSSRWAGHVKRTNGPGWEVP